MKSFLSYFVLVYFVQIQAQLDRAAFELEAHENASYFDREDFSYDTKRQLEKLVYIGESALDDESKLTDVRINLKCFPRKAI